MLANTKKLMVLMLLGALAPTASAQISTGFSGGAITSGCSGDKVQLTGLTLTPTNPTLNQNVTVTVSMKNLCGSTINIPYKVSNYSTNVNSGTKSVSANQTASVQFNWTATQGNHSFDAYLNAGNTLGEATAGLANNGVSNPITFTVAPPPMETQTLMFDAAKQAGAQFNIVMEQNAGCVDKHLRGAAGSEMNVPFSTLADLTGGPPCGSAVFEAFKAFSLKNGWRVKSIRVDASSYNSGNADWGWLIRPTEGSSSPYTRIRLRTNNSAIPLRVAVWLYITIEGPQGTNPYL